MATLPNKIVLPSTTKISLNDRFTHIQQQPVSADVQQVRQRMSATMQASQRNQRLALQMANRPTVMAALKLKKRSLQQRLGQSDVKARLTMPRGQGRWSRGQGFVQRGRSFNQRSFSPRGNSYRGNTSVRGRGASQRGQQRGVGRGRLGRGTPGQRQFRGQGYFRSRGRGGRRAGFQGRGRGGRGVRRPFGNAVQQRGGRGRGRGVRGRGRGAAPPSKEELDSQLDVYMSKTKAHLDAELDAYMSQTD